MRFPLCRTQRAQSPLDSGCGCKAAKVTSAVLLSALAVSAAVAVIAVRRRPELPEPAEAPPRVDDPLR